VVQISEKLKGTLIQFNRRRGLGAVKIHGGDYCYMEFLSGEPEPGDILIGNLENLAGETIFNETQQIKMEVFIEDIYMSKEQALQMIR
jgi:hypothetical protein